MELLTDFKFWAFIITILGLVVNWLATQKVANNHLKHISEDVKEIKEEQKCQKTAITNLKEAVGYLKGKVENII